MIRPLRDALGEALLRLRSGSDDPEMWTHVLNERGREANRLEADRLLALAPSLGLSITQEPTP